MYDRRKGRCPCCRKKARTVLGVLLNVTPENWDNLISRTYAAQLATEGICPWCGRRTTIVARILLGRFAPTMRLNSSVLID
jgi:hypothetical protein